MSNKTTTSAAITPAAAPVTELKFIAREDVRVGRTNPRKRFNPQALAELQASIAEKGLVTPLLVRPVEALANGGCKYELVAGERRFRCLNALNSAGPIPCFVRELTDQQALELQIIENLQRDDLDPLEEAEGYQALLDLGQITPGQLAGRVNKGVGYIYHTLRLLKLPQAGREALLAGKLGKYQAFRIASLPHKEWREEAARIVLDPKGCKINEIAQNFYDHPKGEPMNKRESEEFLAGRYMRPLSSAPFAQGDATLNPDQGPCTTCPKRAGNSPDLLPDLRADMCTDPKCYLKKEEARRLRLVAEAKAKGRRVLTKAEADHAFVKYYGGKFGLIPSAGFVELAEEPDYGVMTQSGNTAKWGALIKGQDVPVVLAIDEAGVVHELADRKLALAAAKQNKPELFKRAASSPGSAADRAEEAKRKKAAAIEKIEFEELASEIVSRLEKEKPSEVFAAAMLDAVLDVIDKGYHFGKGEGPISRVLARRGYQYAETDRPSNLKAAQAFRKTIGNSPAGLLALAIELQLTYSAANFRGEDSSAVFARHYKLDRKKIEAKARLEYARREKAKADAGTVKALQKATAKISIGGVKKSAAAKNTTGKPGGPSKYGKAVKPDSLGGKIMAALQAAGNEGSTVKDLATKLKVKPGSVFSWFYTTGRAVLPKIYKVGEAKYAIKSEEAVAA